MEEENAAEWDLNRSHDPRSSTGEDGWQEITNKSKAKTKQPVLGSDFRNTEQNRPSSGTQSRGRQAKRSRGRWQNSKGQALPLPEQQHKTPKLIDDGDDNPAEAKWRAREPARVFVRVPSELLLEDPQTIHRLAKDNLTFVATDSTVSMSEGSQTYGIWGNGGDTEKTRKAIVRWIEEMAEPKKSARAAKFAKLQSLTPTLGRREEHKWEKNVRRERYRQHPPLDKAFGAIGTFHWPVKEYTPHEILGTNYEALDAIRMDCSSYVVWKKDSFHIMAMKPENVKTALMRLKTTVFQIAAKQLAPMRMYLLHWPRELRSDIIRLTEYEQAHQLSGPSAGESKQHPVVCGEGVRIEHESLAGSQNVASQRATLSATLRTVGKLPYYRGSIEMRVRLGRFQPVQYMLPENDAYDLEEYESMIKESQFQGLVTRELGDRGMEQFALAALQGADGLLGPLSHTAHKLSDVEPTYTAVFILANKSGDLRLTASWEPTRNAESGTTTFSRSWKWTRLDRDTSATVTLLDVSVTNPSTSFGWAFSIEAAQAVEEAKIPSALISFAESLDFDATAGPRQATDKPFVKVRPFVPNAMLKSLEQRITYQYVLQDMDYVVELTRLQTILYPEKKTASMLPSAETQPRVFETRWGVTVHRGEWDQNFAQNEQMKVGEKVTWATDGERWFPAPFQSPDGQNVDRNFSELMARLDQLEGVLRSAKLEDLMEGMTIG